MDLGLFLCAAPCLVGELPGGDVKPVISVTGHALLSAEALCGANRKGEGEGIVTCVSIESADGVIWFRNDSSMANTNDDEEGRKGVDDVGMHAFGVYQVKVQEDAVDESPAAKKPVGDENTQAASKVIAPTTHNSPSSAPCLVFQFSEKKLNFLVDPRAPPSIVLQPHTEALPPSLEFRFPSVTFRAFELEETYMTPVDEREESMVASHRRLKRVKERVEGALSAMGSDRQQRTRLSELRNVMSGGEWSGNTSSNESSPNGARRGGDGEGAQKMSGGESFVEEVRKSLPGNPDANSASSQNDGEKKVTKKENTGELLKTEDVQALAEQLVPNAKRQRLARERAYRLVKKVFSPPTLLASSIMEAAALLPEGDAFLQALGGEGLEEGSTSQGLTDIEGAHPPGNPRPPSRHLRDQLNQIAKDFAESKARQDPVLESQLMDKVTEGHEKIESMLSTMFPDKKGKRKSVGSDCAIVLPSGGRTTGKELKVEDFAEAVNDIVVANYARNLVRWGGV